MTESRKPGILERWRQHSAFPVVYMFAMAFFFTAILVGFSSLTEDRVKANQQVFFEKAVLEAVGLLNDPAMSPERIHARFTEKILPPTEETAGAYRYAEAGKTMALALPFEGRGFWNTIKGVAGIHADGGALTGIAFYEQNETPGLGAEIVKAYFRDPFKGLPLRDGATAIGIAPTGTPPGESEVHGITGATQTCMRLETMVNRALRKWRDSVEKPGKGL